MSNAAQFIFTMRKVSRFHPPDKEVIKEMTLPRAILVGL